MLFAPTNYNGNEWYLGVEPGILGPVALQDQV